MKLKLFITSFFLSIVIFADPGNGAGGGGGPGIKVDARSLEYSPGFQSIGTRPRGDYGDWVVIDGEVVDLQLREGGVVDVEELEDRYRGLVKRDESGQMLIDAKVPIVDYQTQDGRIHQMTKLK
jgi:hypothetical protein